LKDLLDRRFGALSRETVARLDRADVDALDRWSARLLDAESLEDLFVD
jgi:hypothetical protein